MIWKHQPRNCINEKSVGQETLWDEISQSFAHNPPLFKTGKSNDWWLMDMVLRKKGDDWKKNKSSFYSSTWTSTNALPRWCNVQGLGGSGPPSQHPQNLWRKHINSNPKTGEFSKPTKEYIHWKPSSCWQNNNNSFTFTQCAAIFFSSFPRQWWQRNRSFPSTLRVATSNVLHPKFASILLHPLGRCCMNHMKSVIWKKLTPQKNGNLCLANINCVQPRQKCTKTEKCTLAIDSIDLPQTQRKTLHKNPSHLRRYRNFTHPGPSSLATRNLFLKASKQVVIFCIIPINLTKNRKCPEGKFLSNHKQKHLHVTPTRWHLRLLKAALHKHVHRSWIKTGWLHSQRHLPKASRAHHQTNKIEEHMVNHKSTVF